MLFRFFICILTFCLILSFTLFCLLIFLLQCISIFACISCSFLLYNMMVQCYLVHTYPYVLCLYCKILVFALKRVFATFMLFGLDYILPDTQIGTPPFFFFSLTWYSIVSSIFLTFLNHSVSYMQHNIDLALRATMNF